MKNFAIIGAMVLSFGSLATPAFARTAPTAATDSDSRADDPRAAARRYCVVQDTTGSRIPRKTCRTREEWLSQGFDPLAAK